MASISSPASSSVLADHHVPHRALSQPVVETRQVHKRKGEHLINNYRLSKDLGAGQHGKVKEGFDESTGRKVVRAVPAHIPPRCSRARRRSRS